MSDFLRVEGFEAELFFSSFLLSPSQENSKTPCLSLLPPERAKPPPPLTFIAAFLVRVIQIDRAAVRHSDRHALVDGRRGEATKRRLGFGVAVVGPHVGRHVQGGRGRSQALGNALARSRVRRWLLVLLSRGRGVGDEKDSKFFFSTEFIIISLLPNKKSDRKKRNQKLTQCAKKSL